MSEKENTKDKPNLCSNVLPPSRAADIWPLAVARPARERVRDEERSKAWASTKAMCNEYVML